MRARPLVAACRQVAADGAAGRGAAAHGVLRGHTPRFRSPLSAAGTPFQRQVWEELRRIPYGETISYGELARRIGRPTASRAVGAANGRNPIAIVVPCHRVIGADGTLIGYGGGLRVKETLLSLERRATHR